MYLLVVRPVLKVKTAFWGSENEQNPGFGMPALM